MTHARSAHRLHHFDHHRLPARSATSHPSADLPTCLDITARPPSRRASEAVCPGFPAWIEVMPPPSRRMRARSGWARNGTATKMGCWAN